MRKPEFSKIVLAAAVITWLAGAVFGGFIVSGEPALLGELLAYIGAPTATAFGFYAWKAKNENIVKYNKSQIDKLKQLSDAAETEVNNNGEI